MSLGSSTNWDQISAIATILGVIGGLVSVVFLILEVRRNAKAIEGATVQSLMTYEHAVYALLIDHAADFLAGGTDRDGLSAEARFRFDRLVQAYMSLFYSAFKQYEQGLIDPDVWTAYRNSLQAKMALPGFAASWHATSAAYPKPFQALVAAG